MLSGRSGFVPEVKDILRAYSAKLPENMRYVSIMWDEMSIKSCCFRYLKHQDRVLGLVDYGLYGKSLKDKELAAVADHALVFAVQSLSEDMFQPIGYFFTHGQARPTALAEMIHGAVRYVDETDLTTLVLLCDAGTSNAAALHDKRLQPSAHQVKIEGKSICFMFDPVHNIKCARNGLLEKMGKRYTGKGRQLRFCDPDGEIVIDSTNHFAFVDLAHFQALYDHDNHVSHAGAKLHPRLKEKDVSPDNFYVQKVSGATRLFSKTSVTALEVLENRGIVSNTIATRKLALLMNELFDLVNSSRADPNPCRQPLYKYQRWKLTRLEEIRQHLLMWKKQVLPGARLSNLTINHWDVTIQSLIYCVDFLFKKGWFFVQTRRFNQDNLEALFGKIRYRGGRCMNPTLENFIAAFKGCTLQSIMHINPRSNQEPGSDRLPSTRFDTFALLKSSKKELETESIPLTIRFQDFENDDETEEDGIVLPDVLPEVEDIDRQQIYYLSGFTTFRKQLNRRLCSACQDHFYVSKTFREFAMPEDSELTNMRDRGGLEFVQTTVHRLFLDMEKIIRHFFAKTKTVDWIHAPARQLTAGFSRGGVKDRFLSFDYFRTDERTCLCDWSKVTDDLIEYYAQLRIHFKCEWMKENLNPRRGKASDFANRKLVLVTEQPIGMAYREFDF